MSTYSFLCVRVLTLLLPASSPNVTRPTLKVEETCTEIFCLLQECW